MKMNELINKWKINQTVIAKRIGITRGSFSLKVRKSAGQRLTETQQEELMKIIDEFIEDLQNVEIE